MESRTCKIKNALITVWLVFCFVVSIITLIIYYCIDLPHYTKHQIKQFESIKFNTLLYPGIDYFNATWISDDEILTQDYSGNIILYDVNKSIKSVLAFNTMQYVRICSTYELSADKKYLLISYNINMTDDNFPMGNYDVINIKTGKQVTLRDTHHRPRNILTAKWSPTDSSLVIVDNFNIYYIPTVAQPNHAIQITFHGSKDLYNGVTDWVYKEEIFESNCAMWFSTHGSKLAYASFNQTLVPLVYIPKYGIPNAIFRQHSKIFSYHYPKVDDPNPTVELFVQKLNIKYEDPVPIPIKPVKHYSKETLLHSVIWSGDNNLFVMWMNRFQNESHIAHYHIYNNTAVVKELMEIDQENGWLDFRGSFLVNSNHRVALVYPIEQNNGDSYGHVCMIQPNGNLHPVTKGKFEITRLLKWDVKSNYMYYLANVENNLERQQMYRILMNLEENIEPECLTCDTECTFSEADLSQENTYFAHICLGPNIPYVNIIKINGNNITAWETNRILKKKLEDVALPRTLFITVPLVEDYVAYVKLMIPPTVDISSNMKYPLLIYSYGGPIINIALDVFKMDLNMYLSANHNIVIAQVDGRGTSGRGNKTLFANYKKFGTNEVDDQITVAKYLHNNFPFVDERKTGIWGWSFGGYVAGMVLAKDNENIFQCGLSVSPITDWIYYDSMYTERYMGSFKDNFLGYINASLIEKASNLYHKKYMIIHGLSDHNVHFQHTAMLSKELQHFGIIFKQQFYPDELHSLMHVRSHLYKTIISYFNNCL